MNVDRLPHAVFDRTGRKVAQLSNRLAAYAFSQHLSGLNNIVIEPVHCARSSHLTGHVADGSGVQAHSAGGLYPFVLFFREGGAGTLRYCVMGPGIEGELRFATYGEAVKAAERCKAVADSDDAWAFELEALCHVALQRQAAMVAAAGAWSGPAAARLNRRQWQAMGKGERVASLLSLGKTRNTLKLPMTQRPAFATLAAALR
jgi:hypothetical protein